MKKLTYSEQLKHPNWQKRKGELLIAADHTCEHCGSKDKTLHAHHNYYTYGIDPWDYPDDCFSVVFEECHPIYDASRKKINAAIKLLQQGDQEQVAGYALGVALMFGRVEKVKLENGEDISGFAQGVSNPHTIITESMVISALDKNGYITLKSLGRVIKK